MMAKIGYALVALVSCSVGSAAAAQILPPDQSLVHFDRFVAVRERMIPGYSASGIQLGAFTLSPSIDASTEYNDNIFATETNKVNDGYLSITPGVVLQSNLDTRSLTLSASGEIDRFFSSPSENKEQVNLSAYGVQNLGGSTKLRLFGRYLEDRESRESEDAVAFTNRPVRFDTISGAAGLTQQFSSVLISAEAGAVRSHYFDATLMSGGAFDQSYRNNDLYDVRVRAELAQSPSLAYFVQATQNWVDYNGSDSSNRGSDSLELLGGVRFELPIRARGEIGVGYVRANFDDPAIRTFSGVAVNSTLVLFPSDLVTVTLTGQRSVNNAGTATASGYVALTGGVQVDYELLRSFVLGVSAQVERDSFNGFDRRDRRLALGGSAEYRLAGGWWVRGSYDRLDLNSNGTDRYKSFTRNRYQLGLAYRL